MLDYYNIPEMPGHYAGAFPVEANTTIPEGGLVAINAAGNAVPASSSVTGVAVGIAETGVVNNPGAVGAKTVTVRRGVFSLALNNANPPGKANVGGRVWVTAPDEVSTLNTVTCRGGILIGFDGQGRALVDFTGAAATRVAGL